MSKLDHWKVYEPIEDVSTWEASGAGPVVRRLNITANTHTSRLYPESRIALGVVGIGSLAVTPAQSAALRAQLERAERDIHAAQPPLTATGTEGRCESCSRPVRAGEQIVIEDVGTEDQVVLHAGPCLGERTAVPVGSN